jgi:hypothetical protein
MVRVVRKGEQPVKVLPGPLRAVSVVRRSMPAEPRSPPSSGTTTPNSLSPSSSANSFFPDAGVGLVHNNPSPTANHANYNVSSPNRSNHNQAGNFNHGNQPTANGTEIEYYPTEPNSNYENYVNSFVNGYYYDDNEVENAEPSSNGSEGYNHSDSISANTDSAYVNYVNSLMFSLDDGVK